MALHERACTPRRGPEHRLRPEQVEPLLAELEGWRIGDDGVSLVREFRFSDYHHTLAFVNAVAWIAHQQDHHPDLSVHYDRCVVRYSTHDVGGLSLNDFVCAAKVDALFRRGAP